MAFIVIGIVEHRAGDRAVPADRPRRPARALALGLPGTDALGPTVAAVVLIVALVAVSWLAFRDQEL